MGFGPICDLIAHAGSELKAATIQELGLERAREAEENVAFLAPMIGTVARRVLDHPNANRTEFPSAPLGSASFAGMLGRVDGSPIGGTEREVTDLHTQGPKRLEMAGLCGDDTTRPVARRHPATPS